MALAERRIAGEPVARIVGEKAFWSLNLRLSPETLVPRADTETVVEAALAWVEAGGAGTRAAHDSRPRDGDGGNSPGAASASCRRRPASASTSPKARRGQPRKMPRRLGLGSRAQFAVADWTAGIDGRFDLMVSNPPYVRSGDISGLPVEVSRFDPDMALDGGADGLAGFRAVIARLDAVLAGAGAAFIEVGAGQADEVAEIAESHGFRGRSPQRPRRN